MTEWACEGAIVPTRSQDGLEAGPVKTLGGCSIVQPSGWRPHRLGILHAEVVGTMEVWLSLWAALGGARWLLRLDIGFRLLSGPQPSADPIQGPQGGLWRALLQETYKSMQGTSQAWPLVGGRQGSRDRERGRIESQDRQHFRVPAQG